MNLSNKKIVNLTLSSENYALVKSDEKKSELREYDKNWKQKFEYPCGTIKSYDFILIENETDTTKLLVEFKGIKIIPEKKGWFGSKKYYEIELGKTIKEIS
jgi:hypothetical protein